MEEEECHVACQLAAQVTIIAVAAVAAVAMLASPWAIVLAWHRRRLVDPPKAA